MDHALHYHLLHGTHPLPIQQLSVASSRHPRARALLISLALHACPRHRGAMPQTHVVHCHPAVASSARVLPALQDSATVCASSILLLYNVAIAHCSGPAFHQLLCHAVLYLLRTFYYPHLGRLYPQLLRGRLVVLQPQLPPVRLNLRVQGLNRDNRVLE